MMQHAAKDWALRRRREACKFFIGLDTLDIKSYDEKLSTDLKKALLTDLGSPSQYSYRNIQSRER